MWSSAKYRQDRIIVLKLDPSLYYIVFYVIREKFPTFKAGFIPDTRSVAIISSIFKPCDNNSNLNVFMQIDLLTYMYNIVDLTY
jgi:hypothetical protein